MLSVHTQVENLANLLHVRRIDQARGAQCEHAYRSLIAAILEIPETAVQVPAQPRLQPALARIPVSPHQRAA